jgi:hypothetical protein
LIHGHVASVIDLIHVIDAKWRPTWPNVAHVGRRCPTRHNKRNVGVTREARADRRLDRRPALLIGRRRSDP